MEIRLEKEAALVETVLFLEADPVDEAGIARATGLGPDVVEKALELLCETYRENVHGLEPVKSGGGWILAPKLELWESLKDRYGKKSDSRLSRAALETLSIVAYSQPITRPEVEAIRGVSADGMIRFLLEKGFIKEVGKKDAPGRPVQYGTTKDFLKYFRLGSISDLPKLDDLERERFDDEDAPRPIIEPKPELSAEARAADEAAVHAKEGSATPMAAEAVAAPDAVAPAPAASEVIAPPSEPEVEVNEGAGEAATDESAVSVAASTPDEGDEAGRP